MAKDDVIEQISLFQRKLEKYAKSDETDKVLYYIHKLKYLQVTVKHLEATGVGRTVNSLRHHSGLVGNKARDLVNKWKEMVSAEDSKEEEEEEEENNVEYDERTDGDNDVALRDQNGDDMEGDEEDDRLQIEENGSESNAPVPEYRPTPSDQDIGGDSPGGGNDNSYNPLTSKMDYQLLNAAAPSTEYHPSSLSVNYSHSSPEDVTSGWEDASPSTSADRRNEGSSKSSKKSSREDKEKHKKKEKNREKERSKESSSSHDKEKKKDHKHKAKHKEKDKDREEKKKNKSHKHKEKDRHEEKPKERKSEESDEKPKGDKDKKHYVVNGYGALDSDESKSYSVKQDRESEKRDLEDKRKDKNSSSSSHRKEERNREKEIVPEKESSDSEQEVLSKESRVKDSGKDREKSKHHERHSSSSSKKDKLKQDHESQREEEGKKKKSKKSKEEENDFGALLMGFDSPSKKKKKKKKKDRKERESSDDEQPSSSKSHKRALPDDEMPEPSSSKSHKRALTDGEIIEPSSSKSHKRSLTDGEIPEPKKPKLLETAPQKLPKLPASLAGAVLEAPLLPEITPNYKPLPRVPVRDEPANLIHSKMSEEETLNIMLQSKSGRRSKMYSGRSTGLQFVPTLYDCCIRVMIDNIDAIEATGNVPYDILRPVLERASAQQLMNIEDFNPYLLEDTDPLWENHCKKDFRNKKLDDMETWRELWWRCHEEREKKFKSLTETLQQKFISKAEPKRQIKLAFVNDAIKVPKSVARAQAKYGTGIPSGSAVKPGKANEVAARKTAMQNVQRAEKAAAVPRPTSAKNKKVAPLMAKTRQFYKKAFRR